MTVTAEDKREIMKEWRRRIILSLWVSYAAFYLTRVNMSVAIPGIIAEFGFTKTQMGMVLTALFATYAIGQFIHGQLGDRFGGRLWISIGLIGSALINLAFGFSSLLSAMMLLWAFNGIFQSMGWGPTIKTLANWFPRKARGKAAGFVGTSYQIGNVASWALAGFVVGALGWRWAFFIPAIFVLGLALHWAIRGRNAPEEVGLPTIEDEAQGKLDSKKKKDDHLGFLFTLKTVLKSPFIWIVGFGLFALNIVRYGFLDWAPTYLFEVQQATISTAAYKALLIPAAGSFGAIFAGIIATRYFNLRKAPIASMMLFLLAISAFIFPLVPVENWILGLIVLVAIGFFTYGPHVMMVAAMPMDFGTRKAASSAAGFIDCLGYIGAAITGVASGWLIDNLGWNAAFYFWVAAAFAAAILMAFLWKKGPEEGKHH